MPTLVRTVVQNTPPARGQPLIPGSAPQHRRAGAPSSANSMNGTIAPPSYSDLDELDEAFEMTSPTGVRVLPSQPRFAAVRALRNETSNFSAPNVEPPPVPSLPDSVAFRAHTSASSSHDSVEGDYEDIQNL